MRGRVQDEEGMGGSDSFRVRILDNFDGDFSGTFRIPRIHIRVCTCSNHSGSIRLAYFRSNTSCLKIKREKIGGAGDTRSCKKSRG